MSSAVFPPVEDMTTYDNLSLIDFTANDEPALALPDADEHLEDFNFDDYLAFPPQGGTDELQRCSPPQTLAFHPAFHFDNQNSVYSSSNSSGNVNTLPSIDASAEHPTIAQSTESTFTEVSIDDRMINIHPQHMELGATGDPLLASSSTTSALRTVESNCHTDGFSAHQFQSSDYVSGYLACLEDLEKDSHPAPQHQPSTTGISTSFGTMQGIQAPYDSDGNFWIPPTINQPQSLMKRNNHNELESSGTSFVFVNESPPAAQKSLANSRTRVAPCEIGPDSANKRMRLQINEMASGVQAPIRFVYNSPWSSAGNCTPSGQDRHQGRHRSNDAALAMKRKNARKKGAACGICGEQRVKCNAVESLQPCNGCLKRALFNQALAFRICFGYNTKAWKAREGISEFCGGHRIFEQVVWGKFPVAKRRMIKICSGPLLLEGSLRIRRDYIELEVEEIKDPSAADVAKAFKLDASSPQCIQLAKDLVSWAQPRGSYIPNDFIGTYNHVEISDPALIYRISGNSIRDLESQLLQWSADDIMFRSKYPPGTNEAHLDSFLLEYVRIKPPLAMTELVQLTLTAIALARHLGDEAALEIVEREGFNASDAFDEEYSKMASFVSLSIPFRQQLFTLALQYFEHVEEILLQEIDGLVFRNKSDRSWQLEPSCSDPLIVGLCIRRMALQYREIMWRYKGYRLESIEFIDRYETAQKMYDTMIRHYRHVFSGTLSPFDEDWNLEEHAAALGNDEQLIKRFEAVKLAEEYHCKHELDPEDDGVYLSLFVNKQNRRGKSMAKSIGLS